METFNEQFRVPFGTKAAAEEIHSEDGEDNEKNEDEDKEGQNRGDHVEQDLDLLVDLGEASQEFDEPHLCCEVWGLAKVERGVGLEQKVEDEGLEIAT